MSTTVTAPVNTIQLQALVPDLVRSCVVLQPAPPPDPGEAPPAPVTTAGIYTPIAPGVTYANLPTLSIVDDSPDQMIGCIIDTANNPQGRLNALFPNAISGDGVIERATNDIWVYDGALWVNVGPTPGPKPVVTNVIPPWNEILLAIARTRTKVTVQSLAYALELLTEIPALPTKSQVGVQKILKIEPPVSALAFAAQTPAVSSGGSVIAPANAVTVDALVPIVSGGASADVPLSDTTFTPQVVPYVGTGATVIQATTAETLFDVLSVFVASGAAIEPPAPNTALAAAAPAYSNPTPFNSLTFATAGSNSGEAERLGYSFTVGATPLTVNTLAIYARNSTAVESVIIHRNSDGAVIASANVTSVLNVWATASIAPVTLAASTAYTISTRAGGSARNLYYFPTGLSFYAGITFSNYVFGTSEARPTSTTTNQYAFMRFSFV
jgi:hypothetical protein